jgi:hypothetical protein
MADTPLQVTIQKSQARFKKIQEPGVRNAGVGEFFLLVDITALSKDLYIPLSIASGKKPAGFVYQIEGTSEASLSTTDISCSGKGVTQITLGTILYCKIPAGKTATFRLLIQVRGKTGGEYRIVINRINYKFAPTDARYEKYTDELSTKMLKAK